MHATLAPALTASKQAMLASTWHTLTLRRAPPLAPTLI